MTVQIKKRNRDYGIFTWPYQLDFEYKSLLQQKETINLLFPDGSTKKRKVSYKYRRIAVGKKVFEANSVKSQFYIERKAEDLYALKFK